MPTLYIDIYFLINFTVDILAFYFAALFAKVRVGVKGLVFSGIVGGLFACLVVVLNIQGVLFFLMLAFSATVMTLAVSIGVSFIRKLKLFSAFLVFETLLGGSVLLFYNMLSEFLLPLISSTAFGAENKKILILSMLVLLSIGFIRLLFFLFGGSLSEKNADVEITLFDKSKRVSALVDTGNLLVDPMTLTPVIIVKAYSLDSLDIGELKETTLDGCGFEFKKRIRIIPISGIKENRILYGIKPDRVCVYVKSKKAEVSAVIAIDNEKGTFGGYDALIPASILEGVI